MDVLVFKTNVVNEQHVDRVQRILNTIQAIREWNFDLDDCDNILRVVSTGLPARRIEELLNAEGISCKELGD
ncbi:MAG TPA: hypothetical protein VGD22_03075 [Sphingobacteriaceae bacterium]